MNVDPISATADVAGTDGFVQFYRSNLPTVFGYLLRLTGGDRALAEDLTQEAWTALVDELRRGRVERADIRWLLTVGRSRYLDHVRRSAMGQRRLRLVPSPTEAEDEPVESDLLDLVAELEPSHRIVLLLRYVEDLPVPEIARAMGRSTAATSSLLARARRELRHRAGGSDA